MMQAPDRSLLRTSPVASRPVVVRRGFTLLELLMASLLATIIALTALGVIASVARADRASDQRTDAMLALAQIHKTFQRTFRSVLLDLPQRRVPANGASPQAGRANTGQAGQSGQSGGAEDRPAPKPRVLLTEDESTGQQTLEVQLSLHPILGMVNGQPRPEYQRFQPVRGIFEVREEAANLAERQQQIEQAATGRVTQGPSQGPLQGPLAIWWVPLTKDGSPEEGAQVRVAGNLRSVKWQFARTGETKTLEKFSTGQFADWSQIPAYVELEVETMGGQRGNFMYEIAGTTGKPPGEANPDDDLPAALVERLGGTLRRDDQPGDGTRQPDGSNTDSTDGATPETDQPDRNNDGNNPQQPPANPLAGMSISDLIAEFYRRLAQQQGGGQ
jgi:prepilin-type N-terminal cleavage/methylation domain-containing protein